MREYIRSTAVGLLLVTAVSCDTDVSNPGPVQDEFLNDRNAATAMVNGAGRGIAQAINWIGYTGAAVTREIHPAGSTGSFGITNRWQRGELNPDDSDVNVHWEQAQRARWVAEEAVRRLEAVGAPVPPEVQTPVAYANALQLAYIYAGFANRVLGENMCDAVIDGSGILPNSIYFQRAESLFTKALGVAAIAGANNPTKPRQDTIATAGRAAARMYLGNWSGAAADAATIVATQVYNMPYFNIGDDAQRNRIFYSSGNTRESGSAYRAHTQWSTWILQYKYGGNGTTLTAAMVTTPAIVDPRVNIVTYSPGLVGDAAIECCGSVPFFPEAKHTQSVSPVRLTSGREMLLIRAEDALVNGGAGGPAAAMVLINQARTAAGAATITSDGTAADAWRLLKRERGIELWLEARRLGDRRRWVEGNRPGALDPYELPAATYVAPSFGAPSHLDPAVHNPAVARTFCFPVSRSERDTNGNIP